MARRSPQAEEALVEFRWHIAEKGYQIVKRRLEVFVAEPEPAGLPGKALRYNPLVFNPIAKVDPKIRNHEPRLFRNFCELEATQENVLRFANMCGLLVGACVVAPEGRKEASWGEPLRLWRDEVADMKLAFDLWNAVLAGNKDFLKEHITFTKVRGGLVVECRRGKPIRGGGMVAMFTVLDTRTQTGDRARFLKECDYRLAAVFSVQNLIRKRLREHVAASVLYTPDRDRTRDNTRGIPREKRLPLGLRLVPKNLLGALWLQLAREIDQGTEYRRCAMCDTRMEISIEGRRKNSRTCSARCRRALKRKNEDTARTLHEQGKTAREIAAVLRSDPVAVKKWVARPRRHRGRPKKIAPAK